MFNAKTCLEVLNFRDGLCDNINYEHDTIGVSSIESDMFFGFGNSGGDSFDIYTFPWYLDHLNAITGVWYNIPRRKNYWIEGCIEGSVCEQGVLSFHLNYNLGASICSSLKTSIPYTTLLETWKTLKRVKCEVRDSNKPSIFLKN